jgi:hypothetical protein
MIKEIFQSEKKKIQEIREKIENVGNPPRRPSQRRRENGRESIIK